MRVSFFVAGLEDRLDLDPDRDRAVFGTSLYAWILLTFLRLRNGGYPVEAAALPPEDGIFVLHPHQWSFAGGDSARRSRVLTVLTRSDKPPCRACDFEVVQNPSQETGARQIFIPHWPQPGLLARDANRGTLIQNIAFKGESRNLCAWARSDHWRRALETRGLRFVTDEVTFTRSDRLYTGLNWHDYQDVDLIFAVREERGDGYPGKPATKLQNAWLAGVPALLGRESSYRRLWRSPLDYVEVTTMEEALFAIDELRRSPELYAAMVENGRRRAESFSPERILSRWVRVLFHDIPTRRRLLRHRAWRRLPRPVGRIVSALV